MAEKDNIKIRETDLYDPVREYLEKLGYQVQGEVDGCDMTAIMGDELVVVELKTSFNLKLLSQAVKRQRVADSVYVAIPKPKGGVRSASWRDMCMLLRRLELGLITIAVQRKNGLEQVEVHFHPNTFDRLKAMRLKKKVRHHIIKESVSRSGQYNTGGTNRSKLITVYREQAIHVVCCMMRHGNMSAAQLRKLGTCAKTSNILRDNHYGWFTKVSWGIYSLNDCARDFLDGYPELVAHYMKLVQEQEAAQQEKESAAKEEEVQKKEEESIATEKESAATEEESITTEDEVQKKEEEAQQESGSDQ